MKLIFSFHCAGNNQWYIRVNQVIFCVAINFRSANKYNIQHFSYMWTATIMAMVWNFLVFYSASFLEWLRVVGVTYCMGDFCETMCEVTNWKAIKSECNGQSTSNLRGLYHWCWLMTSQSSQWHRFHCKFVMFSGCLTCHKAIEDHKFVYY